MSKQQTLAMYGDSSTQLDTTDPERYKNADWLREQYVEERRTLSDIADEVGITGPGVGYWLKKHNIKTRSGSDSKLSTDVIKQLKDGEWLREQYVEKGRSQVDIANEIGVSAGAISDWFERHGIDVRSQSEERLPNKAIRRLQDEEWVQQQYIQKRRSVADIAEEFDISTTPVKTWIGRHGIEIRSVSEQQLPATAIEKLQDEDWLYQQYVEQQRPASDIGDELDVSATPIYQRLQQYGIEVRSNSEAQTEGDVAKLHDKYWLREQYIDKRRSMREIADEVSVSPTTVKKWLKRHNIESRSSSESNLSENDIATKLEDRDWLYEQYVEDRKSARDIANELGASDTTVLNWLDRHNIKTRSLSKAHFSDDEIADYIKDRDWLYEQYVEKRKSTSTIAEELSTAKSTVKKWIRRHSIKTRSPSESSLPADAVEKLKDEQWMHEQYIDNRKGLHSIADELSISHVPVRTWLERHNIEIRSGVIECEDLGHVVRSSWELEVAELLYSNGINYEYEGSKVQLVDGRTYTPDFVTEDYIIEVKGWVRKERERVKARAAMEVFNDREYVVVGAKLPCDIHIPWDDRESLVELLAS